MTAQLILCPTKRRLAQMGENSGLYHSRVIALMKKRLNRESKKPPFLKKVLANLNKGIAP